METGLVLHDQETKIIYSNQKAGKILGLTQKQMTGKKAVDPAWKFIREDGSPLPLAEYPVNKAIESKKTIKDYKIGIKIPGKRNPKWVLVNAVPVLDKNGIISYVSITFIDITARKQAEEALKESEEKFSKAFNLNPNSMAIIDIETLERIAINDYFVKLVGYSREKLMANPLGSLGEFDPDKIQMAVKAVKKGISLHDVEVILTDSEGSKRVILYAVEGIKIGDRNCMIVSGKDITERKRNEQIQRIIHNISNAVITSHSPDSFLTLVKDELGKIIDTTNFFVALYDETTDRISLPLHHDEKDRWESYPSGKTLTNYVIKTGESLLAKKAMIEKLIKSGEVEQVGNLSEVWLGVPLKSHNKVTGIFAVQSYDNENAYDKADVKMLEIISHQISLSLERLKAEEDLKLAKEKAEESDRLKTAFLHNMSHEIRTPLNGITGFIGLLQDSEIEDDEKQEYFDVINKSSDRLIVTVTDIMDISRIEAGEVKVTKTEVSVNIILKEQYNFFYHQANSKGLELNYKPSLTDSESRIITDPHKLEGILTNLLKNAVKYTETGEITFGCRLKDKDDGKFIEFYVKDTGIGVPAERVEAIFNRFEQTDIEDTMVFEGSGLGLAISKSYVEMLGGNINVKSTEGEGSIFTFCIPYSKQNLKESGATQNKEEEPGISLTNLSVIVAEDEETSRMFLEKVLKNHVKRITYTTTGKETIEKFRENPDTDIILMDIKMADMNGYDATKEIRKFNSDVIIIAQTAYGLAGDKEKALEAGCDDYIAKPIKKTELQTMIQKYFGK